MSFARPRKSAVAIAIASLFVAATVNYAAPPGDPLEGEVRANATTASGQANSAVARDADGDYVVAWSGSGTGDTDGIFLQRYRRDGVAQGGETRVNTTTADVQRLPAVAMAPGGSFVVTWESSLQDGDGNGVFAQRYGADGSAQGGEFQVNTYTTGDQTQPTVGMAASGAFVVAWRSLAQDGSGQGIFAQRYDAAGAAAGGEFLVNTFTANSQAAPSIAMLPSGAFVLAWDSNGQEGGALGQGIYLQRFDAAGVTLGAETHVNTTTAGNQALASVSADATGGFAVAWQGPDASGLGVWLQRYDASGIPVGGETAVNTATAGDQSEPAVTLDASGDLVVAWHGADASGTGIYTQRVDAAGVAQGGETAVNLTTADAQRKAAVAADADGDYVVAWESNLQDGSGNGVFVRRFVGPQDVDLAVSQVDDGDPKLVGSTYNYIVTVTNNHAASTASGVAAIDGAVGSATGVVLTDVIPTGFTFNSATGSGWTCVNASGTVTCSNPSALLAASNSTVTVNVTAPPLTSGTVNNAASVVANQNDSVTANNSATEPTAICAPANAGNVAFNAATFGASETGPTATITAARSGGSCGAVVVNYATSDGTATDGVPGPEQQDYTASSGSLTWADGDTVNKSFTIPLTDDALNEAGETVNLALALPAGSERGALGAQSTAVLTINDNDALPGVTLAPTGTPVAEAGGVATVTATLSAVSGQAVTVNLGFTGTAVLTNDYTRSATSISIPAGETTGTMTLTAVSDLRDEEAETILVDITGVTNGTETGTQQASVAITDDDDPPSVQFTASSGTVAENAGTFNVTAQLSALSGKTVTVDVAATGAATGADYTLDFDTAAPGLQASPLTLAADGVGNASIAVAVTNDTLDEPTEDIILTITSATNATLGTTLVRTTDITDDDATPTVSFSPNAVTVNETDAGTQTVTVTAQLSAVSGREVSVPFTVSGTGVNPQDHNAAAGTIVIAAGGTGSGTYQFQVANDTLDDANTETVVLTMGTPTNATAGASPTHTTSINDNDTAPTISFAADGQSVAEDVAGGTASIVAQLSGPSGRDVSVPFTRTGTATSGSDFTITASPATIPAGSTQVTLTVSIVNDASSEADETVVATLTAPADGSATLASSPAFTAHTLTILDNDAVPQLSFASGTQSVIENVMLGTVNVTLQLSRASADDVTVPISVGGMSSADAGDYAIVTSSPLIIPAGSTTADIVVDITDDAADELDQTVILVLGTPENATLLEPSSTTLTILDDDAPPALDFTPAAQTVAEGGPVTVTVTPAAVSEKAISVTFTVGGNASGGGVDHDAQAASISIPAGSANGSYSFNVAADTLHEADETVAIVLDTPTNASIGTAGTATVTVTDDDAAPAVTLDAAPASVSENGGVITLTATLSEASGADAVIGLAFGGTATDGSDYSHAASSITVPAGSTSATLELDAVNDADAEATETVAVDIDGTTHATEATPQSASASITDDDTPPAVSLALTGSPMAETGGVATVTANLSAVYSQQVVVNLNVSGVAKRPADYSPSALSITIPAGSTSGSITLTAASDALDEVSENIVVSIASVTGGVAGSPNAVTAAITDDDATPTVSLSVTGSPLAENGGVATFTATLSAASGRVITVGVGYSGTATGGSDYTSSANSITINPGELSGSVTVTGTDDSADEPNETVVVRVTTVSAVGRGTPQQVSASIADDDAAPSVTLGLTGSPLAENGGVATVTATLSAASGRTVQINLNYAGSATDGSDYTRSGVMIVIPAGSTSGDITLTAADDALDEANENIVVRVGSASNATFTAPLNVTASIADDDDKPTVTLDVTGSPLAENGGVATVTATLDAASGRTVVITLGLSGTAGNGVDYSASATTITIPAGSTSGSITLTGIDDSDVDADETAIVDITAVPNAMVGVPSQVTATIGDDD